MLRLVLIYLTCAIHGEIKVVGDEVLPTSRLSIWLTSLDTNRTYQSMYGDPSPRLDSRKHFVVEGLAAGTYEMNVAVNEPGQSYTTRIYQQQVTVADNAVSEMTITIKPKP